MPHQKVSAAWWNDSWNYRQAINISSHNTTESNVYIIATISIGSTTKAQVDNGDFRFVTQSGDILPYYISSGTGTTAITFHLQFSSFPSGAQTIYAYYGNSTVTDGFSASDFSTQASNYSIGSYSSEEAGGGPVAYWKFDEGVGTTVHDSSTNQNTGTLGSGNSTPTWSDESQCVSGKCLLFDGNNNQSISLANAITSNSNIRSQGLTVETWVKLTDSGKEMKVISQSISSGYSDISSGGIGIRSTNKASFIAYDDGVSYKYQDSNTTLQTNQWYFIVGTFNPLDNKMNIYINGKLDSSATVTATLFSRLNSNDYNKFGTIYQNGTNRQFFGYIDETKIYPYARTAAQIKLDYNSRGSKKGSSVNLGVKSNTAPSLKSKLFAYYKFDENNGTTVYDSSGNNKNGTINLANWSSGKFGKAISFMGDTQSVIVSNSSSLGLTNNFTVSAWVYPRETASGTYKVLVGKATTWTDGYALGTNTTKFQFLAANGVGYTIVSDNSDYSLNTWYHLVATYSNSTLSFYVNGVLKDQKNMATITASANDFYIGGLNGASNRGFNSIIDEVKIYNAALSADEVKQDYNAGSAIQFGATNQTIGGTTTSLEYCIPGDTSPCSPPVAEWKMDEKVGTSTVDTSGNNFTGTITGATWSQGKIGGALNFRGDTNDDYFSTSYPSSPPSSFTTEAWIKPDSVSGSGERGTYGYTIMAASYDGSRYPVWITVRNGEIRASAFVDTHAYTETSGANLQPNKWYHIAVSATQNSTATIYINGIGKTSFTAGNVAWDVSDKMTIADLRPGRNISFDGLIDHIKIYNYARTPAQIAYDYNKGGPVGWWKLDECQGNIAYDWSGIGNSGAINIGPSGTQNSLGTCAVGTSAAWTNGTSGKINSSLNFDGTDDYMTAPISVSGTEATIAFWVKNPAVGAGSYLFRSNANVRTYFHIGGSSISFTKGNPAVGLSGGTINTSIWNHIVLKWWTNSGITYALGYINGKASNSGIGTSFTDTSQGSYITVAGFNTTGTQNTSGQFDDIRVYNYALTDDQIKQVYNGGAVNFQ